MNSLAMITVILISQPHVGRGLTGHRVGGLLERNRKFHWNVSISDERGDRVRVRVGKL